MLREFDITKVSMKEAYKFKLFKKNIKFKRFNRGFSKFIVNRKKYILRKRRSNFLVYSLISKVWINFYRKSKQLVRFYQSFNIFPVILPVPLSYNHLYTGSHSSSYSSSTISKKLLFSSTLFDLKHNILNFYNISGNKSLLHVSSTKDIRTRLSKSSRNNPFLFSSRVFFLNKGLGVISNEVIPRIELNILLTRTLTNILLIIKSHRRIVTLLFLLNLYA